MGDIFNALDSGDREKSIDDFKLFFFKRQVFPGIRVFYKGCQSQRKGIIFVIVFDGFALSHGAIEGNFRNIVTINGVILDRISLQKTINTTLRKFGDDVIYAGDCR